MVLDGDAVGAGDRMNESLAIHEQLLRGDLRCVKATERRCRASGSGRLHRKASREGSGCHDANDACIAARTDGGVKYAADMEDSGTDACTFCGSAATDRAFIARAPGARGA